MEDPNGGQVGIFVSQDFSSLAFEGADGKMRILLLSAHAGDNYLSLHDRAGLIRMTLGTRNNRPGLGFDDKEGNTRFVVQETEDGARVKLYNKTGEGVVEIYADKYGNGVVGAFDRKGMGKTLKPGP